MPDSQRESHSGPELPTLTLSHSRHISNYSRNKTKKHDLAPSSLLFKLLDGADGVYGWLHPEVSDRRRDTPKDNERNDHIEKSDDESELRLGV